MSKRENRRATNDGRLWVSIFGLMANLRDETIELVREEIAELAVDDMRFRKIRITMESDKSHVPPKDRTGISVYIGTQMLMTDEEGDDSFFTSDGFKLIFKVRISDHEPNEKTIWADVNEKIWVQGDTGVKFQWSDLDHKTQKMNLYPEGGKIVTRDIAVHNAKFSISPRDQGEIVNKCKRSIINAIYEITDGTFDPQAGGKL